MKQWITGSFGSLFCCLVLLAGCAKQTVAPTPRSEILIELRIVTLPAKTVYAVGEPFDPAGILVRGRYADNRIEQIPIDELIFGGFDSSAPAAQQTVTVTFSGLTEEFSVSIQY